MSRNPIVYSILNKSFLPLNFIKATTGQYMFGRFTVLNITPFVYLKVKTTRKSGKLKYIIIEKYPK